MKKLGYIGKSFAMGTLGLLGTLVACGGGGITSAGANGTSSPYIAFAMGYEPHPSPTGDQKWKTLQGGDVNMGSGGYAYGGYGIFIQTDIDYHQSVGIQFFHSAALANTDYIYMKIEAPNNGSVDASATTKMLIQMGNDKAGAEANTANTFTVSIEGGDYDSTSFTYTHSCTKNVDVSGSNLTQNKLLTYSLALSGFTCTQGNVVAAKGDLKAVTVKVLASENSASAATTTGNYVLPKVATIAFTE